MRDAVGVLPQRLHLGPLESLQSDPVRELSQAAGRRPGEDRGLRRQALRELGLHVDVRIELVHQKAGDRLLDVAVLEQLAAGLGPGLGLQRLTVGPDGVDGDDAEEDPEHDQRGDELAVRTAGGLGALHRRILPRMGR